MKSFNISLVIYLVSLSSAQYKSINTELRTPYVRALKNNAKYLCLSVKEKLLIKQLYIHCHGNYRLTELINDIQ